MSKQRQRGFAVFTAIFFLVVVGALGGYMLQFSSTQQLNSAQDLQGSRAEWAAHGALDWAIASVLNTAACEAPPAMLESFTLQVSCVAQTYDEAGLKTQIFHISVIAQSQVAPGTLGFIERSLSATVEK
jgi:MSHA biogenesis protein MshP